MPQIVFRLKGGVGSGFHGHEGRPGKVGGSVSDGEFSPPKGLPKQLNTGSSLQVQKRQRERVKFMEYNYPGVKFSYATYNSLAVKRNFSIPGISVPRAIYDKNVDTVDDKGKVSAVMNALKLYGHSPGRYISFTMAKYATGMKFQEVMGVFKYAHTTDPYKARLTIDRMGSPTAFAIDSDNTIVKEIFIDKQYSSSIVGFDFSDDEYFRVRAPSKEHGGVDNFHMTLVNIGKIESGVDIESEIGNKLRQFASEHAPISGKFNGLAYFEANEDGKIPFVMTFDSPQLPEFRQQLRNLFPECEQEHGFVPHVTLGYVDVGGTEITSDEGLSHKVTIDSIVLFLGDEKFEFPLIGDIVYKGGPGSGFHGHEGRPGKVGGSVSGNFIGKAPVYGTFAELIANIQEGTRDESGYYMGVAALITPDDKLIGGNEHSAFLRQHSDDTELLSALGIHKTKGSIHEHITPVLREAISAGTIRVRITGKSNMNIQTDKIDTATLRRLHRLVDEDKLVLSVDGDNVWEENFPTGERLGYGGSWIDFTYEEFMSAKRVVYVDNNPVLKEASIVEKQLPIDEESKRNLIQARTAIFHEDSNNLARSLYTGEISIGSWEETMKKMIRELHSSSAAVGKGGWDQMTYADWGRLGPVVKDQYRYLHGFADHIAENAETMTIEAIQARARMYGNAGAFSSVVVQAGDVISKLLPWLPKDGQSRCLVNCRCYWALTVVDAQGDWVYVQCVWHLRPAEHCDDCLERDNHVELIRIHKTVPIPANIG